MVALDSIKQRILTELSRGLINQEQARVVVAPRENGPGFWFGAGNIIETADGCFYLCGRYRNSGDSRTGLEAGARGAELAFFRSDDRGKSFKKILSFGKKDLGYSDRQVLSIERCWMHPTEEGMELYLSSEKTGVPYPRGYEAFQKPGTGVWSIDRIVAPSLETIDPAAIQPLLQSSDPRVCHVKDPVVYSNSAGDTILMFCTHPFNWASANTGMVVRPRGSMTFGEADYAFFPRGFTWDVAACRITGVLKVPRLGVFSDGPQICLFFYDGAESMRNLQQHEKAVKRPRGYSCEELGGAAYGLERAFPRIERLSAILPFFVSPYGSGCSRYVAILATQEGIYATWQQSQADLSQPLVLHFMPHAEIEAVLEGNLVNGASPTPGAECIVDSSGRSR